MSKKFKHLDLSPHWQQYFAKYPQGYTIIENLIDWVSQVDDMVDNQNELNGTIETYGDRLDEFIGQFDTHLQEIVEQTLSDWQNSGFLNIVINEALDTKYHEMDNRLTGQLEQIVIDPKFETSDSSQGVTLGDNLLGSGVWTSTGWTGNAATGFTNNTGSTSPLQINFTGSDITNIFMIEFTATNVGQQPGGTSDFYVSLNDSEPFETYKGTFSEAVYSFGLKTNTPANTLKIIPRSHFTGTIKNISVREITSSTTSMLSIMEDSINNFEIRTGARTLGNVFMGIGSGQSNVDGNQNTSVGHRSMMNNTSGFWNVAQGFEALRDNTVGTRNVAIGRIALRENTSGDRNIGIGPFALTRNTTGRSNIGIGADALWYNTEGNYNIGIGLVALGDNATGMDNIGIGRDVMGRSDGGENNLAMGHQALYFNEGNNNVGFGKYALVGNTTGSFNIGIGFEANRRNTTGRHNVGLGYEVLHYSNNGDNNIAVGNRALTVLNNSSNNVAIGAESLIGLESGGRNTSLGIFSTRQLQQGERNVAIGYNAGMNMTNGDNNVLIGANVLGDGVGEKTGDRNIIIGFNVTKPTNSGSDQLNIGNVIKSTDMTGGLVEIPQLRLTNLPREKPSQGGHLWIDGTNLAIS